ncbi:MAG: efflux RND transporter periplasmic adaptor subunit [Sphingomonas sp.]|uniref:efflux RND transporter periplasmic adaptor subunit n=1 Tax=Sphingomonas sp. TaxID=28214 RepID=UPI0025D69FB9|nr:efflux RND transporter periplasmic adaptor subunit [Sphingomonas sp.]MBY0283577.1 efflux RND transporter periplasmic adaptor subunit [Sphingomonas sp.]
MADASASDLNDFLGVRPVPAWRRWGKWVLVAIGVVLLILLVASFFKPAPKASYATDVAQKGTLTVTVSATGKLAPTNRVDVGSEVSGLVSKVLVDVNDHVVKGQPIALIDPSRFRDSVNQSQAQLASQQAAVAQAQATLAQSSAQLKRLEEVSRLSGGRVPAKTEMEQAIADRDRAIANVRAAQANVAAARATLSSNEYNFVRAVIRSPVNGVVLARQVEPGQTVAASFNTPTLFVIAEDLTRMKLEVSIDEADVGEVRAGQKASFTVDAFPGETFPADITRVNLGSNLSAQSTTTTSTATTNQVVSYSATLAVSNPDIQLRPGMTATAEITTTQKTNVLLVPNGALRFRPTTPAAGSQGGVASVFGPPRLNRGGPRTANAGRGATQTLYVLDADGNIKPVEVRTGDTNGTLTEITGGDLKPGQKVVTGELSAAAAAAKPAVTVGTTRVR